MSIDIPLKNASLGKALSEFFEIKEILSTDVTVCASMLKTEDNQFWRRMLVRSVFALIEGTVYRMKQLAFEVSLDERVPLSRAEIALLVEEGYDLNDKGEPIVKSNHLNITKGIRFAFKASARAYGISYALKVDDSGWDSFKKALKVRDRLMHPKSTSDVNVVDDDVLCLERAVSWFAESVNEIQSKMVLSLNEKIGTFKTSKS
jgi:hypothetical protein